MKNLIIVTIILLTSAQISVAQKQLPVLKANSNLISINDGNVLTFDAWEVSPAITMDEYVCTKFETKKKVSFISDIDTISFIVKPYQQYDFIILLNGKEKAHTRISTDFSKEGMPNLQWLTYTNNDTAKANEPIVIPFKLGEDNRIHLKGSINGSENIDILFDTGANAVVLKSSLLGEKVNMILDGITRNTGSDGISMKQTSSKNTIKIGDLVWNNVRISSINYKNTSFDVVLGWIAFGGKIVEIDYQNQKLIIYKSMPTKVKEYSKIKTAIIRDVTYIQGTITVDDKNTTGWFEYDTGGVRSFYMSQEFTNKNNLNVSSLEVIEQGSSSGSKGVKIPKTIYRLPKLKIGDFEMYQVPVGITHIDPEGVTMNDILGGQLLKKFNAIIDLKNYNIYMKPNSLIYKQHKKKQ